MTNKVYSSLIKMAALTLALASASCCCCNNGQKRAPAPRAVPQKAAPVQKNTQVRKAPPVQKSAPVQTPCNCRKTQPRKVIPVYRTNEILNFDIQTKHPLPGNYVTPYNEDGTSFPIQSRNPLPGNWYYGRCY